MGSNLNWNEPPGGDGGNNGRSSGNFPLTRQSSVYSLTFDEFQNTLGGMGKDFGSMNMDELLKNIWSAEETQSMTTAAAAATTAAAAATTAAMATSIVGQDGGAGGGTTQPSGGGYLQRQGSLTLPRTISQKTVDEVWKGLTKENNNTNGNNISGKDGQTGGSHDPQRQQTLGEVTLEEFLFRAGVVMENNNNNGEIPGGKTPIGGIFGACNNNNNNNNTHSTNGNSSNNNNNNNNNTGFGISFQQPGNRIPDGNHQIPIQPTNLPISFNGVRTSLQQSTPSLLPQQQQQQRHLKQQQQQQQQQTTAFPKQVGVSYSPVVLSSATGQLGSPGVRGSNIGLSEQGGMGSMFGMGGGGGGVHCGSPATLSSDGLGKSNGDTSSVSPVPYVFNGGGMRGKKGNSAVDKVVERRQRRMIKNRESAARSRARKQAYTMELEQEVAKLKSENQELRKKQQEIMEMQRNQVLEMLNAQSGPRKRLRRTQTGPW